MDLTNFNTIKNLCNKFGLHPSKSMGQNFLLGKSVVEKIVEAAELNTNDTVLEIGPGFGVLTEELVKRAGRVTAVEMDRRLFEYNKKNKDLKKIENLEIINEDVLNLGIKDYGIGNKYKIVSNLPYQITSPVLWKFLHEDPLKITDPLQTSPLARGRACATQPELMVLMVQKEVGERICAKPGKMSVLSVMCQFYADCEFLLEVKRDQFYPAPEVDSAVVKLRIKKQELRIKEGDFIRLVKFGFSAKRKMLKNNLSAGLQKPMAEIVTALKSVGLDEKVRAQELSVKEWIKLNYLLTS